MDLTARIGRRRLAAAAGCGLVALVAPVWALAVAAPSADRVARVGTVQLLHGDDRAHGRSTVRYALETTTGVVQVDPGARAAELTPGTKVRLTGVQEPSGRLSLAGTGTVEPLLAALPVRAAGTRVATLAQRSTAVVIMGSNVAAADLTPATANAVMFGAGAGSVDHYYREQTYDQIGFQGDVLGPFVGSGFTAGECEDQRYLDQATAFAAAAGKPLTAYQHVIVVMPYAYPACPFSGEAYVAGRNVWINGGVSFTLATLAHELGHNLGVYHAGKLDCGTAPVASPLAGSCVDPEASAAAQYGDPFDPMGYFTPTRQMSALFKSQIGVLGGGVQVLGTGGDYHIAPLEQSSGTRALAIPIDDNRSYVIDVRAVSGSYDNYAPSDPAVRGVMIRRDAWSSSSYPHSLLVNTHAATSNDWHNAPLLLNETFTDAANGISVQLLALDPSGATVRVAMPTDTTPPSSPVAFSATAADPDEVTLRWRPAADLAGVASFQVTRDGTALATVASTTSFTDNPAPLGRVYTYVDRGVPNGGRHYSLVAVDGNANRSPETTVDVLVGDVTAPSRIERVQAKVSVKGTVALSWLAAIDDRGVTGYRILRNGGTTPIAVAPGASFTDSAPKSKDGKTISYTVVSIDAAGNGAAESPPATVRLPLVVPLKLGKLSSAARAIKRSHRVVLRLSSRSTDPLASCSFRIGSGRWRPCLVRANGVIRVTTKVRRPKRGRLTVGLRVTDELGRRQQQTSKLRVRG